MPLGRVLITGGAGQLGSDLLALLPGDGSARALTHAELDIADDASIERALDEHAPDVVVNCAAYHVVDRCEQEDELAWRVNVRAVRSLARRCAERGAKLVHFSTNYVFDGERDEPYGEDDVPAPRSVYALTKLAGEHAALAYAPGALVARTAGLYGLAGNASKGGNFIERVLGRAREGAELRMVADQRLTPTFTADLAAAALEALERNATGLVHLTNAGACSWHEFTLALLENAGLDVPVEPVPTTVPPGGAARPRNGVLARPRADALGLTPLRPWRAALDDYMARAGFSA